jgi:hypothetical protein
MRVVVLAAVAVGLCLGAATAVAQTACQNQTTASLLAQFADTAPNGSILQSSVRNVICSTQQLLAPGVGPSGQTLGSSPFAYTAPQAGLVTVSSGEVELTRQGITVVLSLTGGSIRVNAADVVTVIWFQTVPTVYWWADG